MHSGPLTFQFGFGRRPGRLGRLRASASAPALPVGRCARVCVGARGRPIGPIRSWAACGRKGRAGSGAGAQYDGRPVTTVGARGRQRSARILNVCVCCRAQIDAEYSGGAGGCAALDDVARIVGRSGARGRCAGQIWRLGAARLRRTCSTRGVTGAEDPASHRQTLIRSAFPVCWPDAYAKQASGAQKAPRRARRKWPAPASVGRRVGVRGGRWRRRRRRRRSRAQHNGRRAVWSRWSSSLESI